MKKEEIKIIDGIKYIPLHYLSSTTRGYEREKSILKKSCEMLYQAVKRRKEKNRLDWKTIEKFINLKKNCKKSIDRLKSKLTPIDERERIAINVTIATLSHTVSNMEKILRDMKTPSAQVKG